MKITRAHLRRLIKEEINEQVISLLNIGEDPSNPTYSYFAKLGPKGWMIHALDNGVDITADLSAAGAIIYQKSFATPDEARAALAEIMTSPMNEVY